MSDQSYQPPQIEIEDTPPDAQQLIRWASTILTQMPRLLDNAGLSHQRDIWLKAAQVYLERSPELMPLMELPDGHESTGILTMLTDRTVLGAPLEYGRPDRLEYLKEIVDRWANGMRGEVLVLPFPVDVRDER